jgi:hypothetical protein
MSIYGPSLKNERKEERAIDMSKYAERSYVNIVAARHVSSIRGRMKGPLHMAGHVLQGLPTSEAPISADMAPSWAQVTRLVEARKPIIAVWAEEGHALLTDSYEWSFGDSSTGPDHKKAGYPLAINGRILRMSLVSVLKTSAAGGRVKVNIAVNGQETTYGITKPAGQSTSYVTFETPLEVTAGSTINFVSKSSNPSVSANTVALLIELNT